MVCWWQRLHDRSWQVRWPIKWATLVVVTLIVCFPYPRTLLRHLAHARNPNLLIEPDAPALAPLLITLRPQIRSAQDHHETLRIVQQFVHETIPYAFDWETWGVVDYLPTVEELLSKKREDCDGRAVLAASLLRNLGYEANLVTDGLHTWVWTPQGETMGPRSIRSIRTNDDGRISIDWRGLRVIPEATAFGIAVFPWQREAIICLTVWFLLMRPGIGWKRATLSAVMIALALAMFRYGGNRHSASGSIACWFGTADVAAALALACLRSKRRHASDQ